MNIIQDFIPAGRRNRPGYKLDGPRFITVHDTANTSEGANAEMHSPVSRGQRCRGPASWHFTVDDLKIIQHLPLEEVCVACRRRHQRSGQPLEHRH